MRVLFVSNGHGEDSMVAEIVRRLPGDLHAEAYPTLGAGLAFEGVCAVVGPRAFLASQGERMVRGSIAEDVRGGIAATFWPAIRFMRKIRGVHDKIVVVGDLVGPALCWLGGSRASLYVDVFRTGHAHRYSFPERWLLARAARTVFCRDDRLAGQLRQAGLDARAPGNLLLDTIPRGDYDPMARRRRPLAVAILPGSRGVAAAQFALQVNAMRKIPEADRPDFFVALAPGIEPAELAAAAELRWQPPISAERDDLGRLLGDGLEFQLARRSLGNLLDTVDVVLSLAGTASWQAIGSGVPVVSAVGGNTRPKRLRNEAALTGDARQVCPPDPDAIAAALLQLLADPDERARRGAIGRERMGEPGAIDAILAELR